MDEKRKRIILAGVIVGAVSVGLVVLSRRVPREKLGETLGHIGKDALKLVKMSFGNNFAVQMAERALEQVTKPADAEVSA
jgi:hypothetical protein